MKYNNLTIIGTSHIAKQSVVEITDAIYGLKPDIIALELDHRRYHALLNKIKHRIRLSDIRRIGIKGFIFALLGQYAQKTLGKYAGLEPGSDMLTAINLAHHRGIKISFIDQDIEITFRRFSQALTWHEKWNFIVDLFRAIFFRKSEIKKLGIENFDLTKVPEKKLIEKLLKKLKDRYPFVYKVLITERNTVISRNLYHLMQSNQDKHILAVVGAGHVDNLLKLIKKLHSNKADATGSSLSYSFTTNVSQ